MRGKIKTGAQILLEYADQCLALIEQAAQKISIQGVAVVAFIPGNSAESWVSKMKVVDAINNESANYLAIAYSKAAEMAITCQNSGSAVREPLLGEFGFPGGLIKNVGSGYILAVFSGGSDEEDVEVATVGLNWLYKKY